MKNKINTNNYYKPKQLKLPLEIEKIIEISDPVYSFCEIVDCIDFNPYFVEKGYKTGRPRCDAEKLLKVQDTIVQIYLKLYYFRLWKMDIYHCEELKNLVKQT